MSDGWIMTLYQSPALAIATHPETRDLDRIEAELLKLSPHAAIISIEAKWLGGYLSRDDALALVTMHTERLSVEVCRIERRISGVRG